MPTRDPARAALNQGRKILVVDDHRNIRLSLKMTLTGEGAYVTEAESVQSALSLLGLPKTGDEAYNPPFDCILLDIRLPDGSGLDILRHLSEVGAASKAIMMSGEGTVGDAFKATQMGAFDFVEKPFGEERIIVSVARCLDFGHLSKTKAKLEERLRGQEILGDHPAIQETLKLIKRVAPTNGRVLITGESGTGKELVARAIHRESTRADKPLIKVNCAAIPHNLIESELFGHEKGAFTGAVKTRKGVFERADGGTLFLDEIGELGLEVQAKLLRALQNGEIQRVGGERLIHVDVRLLAATNRDLPDMVAHGEFREDLFYRLEVLTVHLPPLRERPSDIRRLAQVFLAEACEEHSLGEKSLSEHALGQLAAYHWPGNVRELHNLIERVAILAEETVIDTIDDLKTADKRGAAERPTPLTPESLAAEAPGIEAKASPRSEESPAPERGTPVFHFSSETTSWQDFHDGAGRAYLRFILQKAGGNVSEAARILSLERAYLHRLMKRLGVQRDVIVS